MLKYLLPRREVTRGTEPDIGEKMLSGPRTHDLRPGDDYRVFLFVVEEVDDVFGYVREEVRIQHRDFFPVTQLPVWRQPAPLLYSVSIS